MFIGHFAPALVVATHKKAPSLPVLFIAAQLVDWAFFVFVLAGVEAMRMTPGISVMNPLDLYHMPYTHSLVGGAAWAAGFAALVWLLTKNRTGALLAAAVVLSHWFLDVLVHVKDMTIAGSPPKLGMGLWNYPAIEMPLELGLIAGSFWLYARSRNPARGPLLILVAVLLALQLFQWFGPADERAGPMLGIMAFAAFGVATLAAWWAARSEAAQ